MKHSRIFAIIRDDSDISAICAIPSSIVILFGFIGQISRLQTAPSDISRASRIEMSVTSSRNHFKSFRICVQILRTRVALQITQLKVQGSLSQLCELQRKATDISQGYARTFTDQFLGFHFFLACFVFCCLFSLSQQLKVSRLIKCSCLTT